MYQRPGRDEVMYSREVIDEVMKKIKPRYAEVLRLRFGLDDGVPKTLTEIGKIWGVGYTRVSQIETKALRNLSNMENGAFLVDLYDVGSGWNDQLNRLNKEIAVINNRGKKKRLKH